MLRFVVLLAVGAALTGCGSSSSPERVARSYSLVPGDVITVPKASVRCRVEREAGSIELACSHSPKARYDVVFYADNLFVYTNGKPDNPVFSARGTP